MISTDRNRCLRCGGCVGVCPVSALTLTEHGITCSQSCISCRSCASFCPVGAISMEHDWGKK